MPRTWPLAVATALGAIAGHPGLQELPAQVQRPAFRGGVEIVSFQATATDAAGRYLTDLDPSDFVVLEDGVQQRVVFFSQARIPLALALLLDSSASMEGTLATAQEAAVGFARQLGPDDVATVIDFDSRVQILHGFTNDGFALEHAIRRTRAGGSTALYNAVYIAIQEFNKLTPEQRTQGPRGRAIIVLSDGEDTSSLVTFEDVLDLAVRSDTVIYTIGIGSRGASARRGFDEGQFVLKRLAQQTGGRAFVPLDAKDLVSVYSSIRKELSNQYALAYESSNPRRDGQWRRLVVRVTRTGAVVRARPGYYAPSR